MEKKKITAIFSALIAAVFYALSTPLSKTLLRNVPPTMMAAFLYLGAGVGIGALSMLCIGSAQRSAGLSKNDLPYVVSMVLLDIAAPVFLMFGLTHTNASAASLLNNFEIAATSVIALFIFGEKVTARLWAGIALITISTILLSCSWSSLSFSWGSLLVIAATVCWGFENNCTRKISSKNTFEIVFIKGIFSGAGSLVLALLIGEKVPQLRFIVHAMLLGFVAYGLSIFYYIKAQSTIGAAKTSAYYAVAPFVGALVSFVFLHEALTGNYLLAFCLMVAGSVIVVADTLRAR